MGVLFTSKDRIEIVKISDDHYVVMADKLKMVRTPRIEINSGFRSKCYGALVKEVEAKNEEIKRLKETIEIVNKERYRLNVSEYAKKHHIIALKRIIGELKEQIDELTENRSF